MKLSVQDVSKCLNLPVNTIERWVRQGRIPMKKSGTVFFIQSDFLKKWAAEHNLLFSLPSASECIRENHACALDTLYTAMTRGGVFHHVAGDTVQSVLKNAVSLIPEGTDDFRSFLLEKLLEREELTSTGVGRGVAIPHPRSPTSAFTDNSIITTCFLENPVDFQAVDDKPVFILFLLISPSTKHHLHLLSRLAYCVRNDAFTAFLKTCPSSEMLLNKIVEFEAQLDASV